MKTASRISVVITLAAAVCLATSAPAADNMPPEGFVALFNGKDLSGWKEAKGKEGHWKVEEGVITYDGKGDHLTSDKEYRNFVLHVDWKITKGGDSGVYLRGLPQVQIWDNPVGSGGLWNDKNDPTKKMDKPIGEWNHFEITVENDLVTVFLNGEKVVDKFPKKWGKKKGPFMLQHHGSSLWFKNIYLKELPG